MSRYVVCISILFLSSLLPLLVQAKPSDQIIFRHPYNKKELWMADVRDTRNAELVFKHTENIWKFAVQRDGPYIAFIAKHILHVDVFLYDRTQPNEPARNLTRQKYGDANHLAISKDGDIVFINSFNSLAVDWRKLPEDGIMLFHHSELSKKTPRIKLFVTTESRPSHVSWNPVADQIVYSIHPMAGFKLKDIGIYTRYVNSSHSKKISDSGYSPDFSTDGKKIAYHNKDSIVITDLRVWGTQRIIPLEWGISGYLKWAPNGDYIAHYSLGIGPVLANIKDGSQKSIFEKVDKWSWIILDWVYTDAYPVEPVGRMSIL